MISAITPEPSVSGTTNLMVYRYRPTTGERTVLPDSAAPAPKNARAGNETPFSAERPAAPPMEQPSRDSSSMFAAAVIAGALSPTPQTMEELMLRIGTSTIPEESEARLKDLLA